MIDPAALDRRRLLVGAGATAVGATMPLLGACATSPTPAASEGRAWVFDRLSDIGGVATHVEGQPRLIDSPWGKAVKFDGVDDALFIDEHPLAGAATFTLEALFRPDGGAHEQRWMHLASDEPEAAVPGGGTPGTRFLFEIRVEGEEWWLDAFTKGPGYNHTLIFPDKRFPVGQWFHVAQTFDGTMYRSFVDGVLQGEAPLVFTPQGPGRSSVGVRINRVNWFNGAVREARFTPRGLAPSEFRLPLP